MADRGERIAGPGRESVVAGLARRPLHRPRRRRLLGHDVGRRQLGRRRAVVVERHAAALQPRLRSAAGGRRPDASTQQALLDRGYALAGSSYDPAGSWWALASALRDQFETLGAVRADLPSRPRRVIAFGTSMGGLISALEGERGQAPHRRRADDLRPGGRCDRAGQLSVGRRVRDGQAACAGGPIKLVRFARRTGPASGKQLDASPSRRRARRRVVPVWRSRWRSSTFRPGRPVSPCRARRLRRPGAAAVRLPVRRPVHDDGLHRVRPAVDRAGGGWQPLVDGRRRLRASARPVVLCAPGTGALPPGGTGPRSDLGTLTAGANIRADAPAVRWLGQTSVPPGRLEVPELDLHTISDQLVPVQHENAYARSVSGAGASSRLRQAYVRARATATSRRPSWSPACWPSSTA